MSATNKRIIHRVRLCKCGSGLPFRDCCLWVETAAGLAEAYAIAYGRPSGLEFQRLAHHRFEHGLTRTLPEYP